MSMMINYFAALPLPCLALPCPANLPCFFLLIITVTDLALFTFLPFAFPPSELHEKVHD